jgi:hypothetical protein
MGWVTKFDPAPTARVSTFVPPPEGRVSLKGMKLRTLRYWKTVRLVYLAGYNVNWMIPGQGGTLSSSDAAVSLDVRLRPVPELFPERTSLFDLEPFVIVKGSAHVEPELGTVLVLSGGVNQAARDYGGPPEAFSVAAGRPGELGEQARWLPEPGRYVAGVWSPSVAPTGLDANVRMVGTTGNLPRIVSDYTYRRLSGWQTVPVMDTREADHFRFTGIPMSSGRVSFFVTAVVETPAAFWTALFAADEPTGVANDNFDDLELRLMPDGNLHLYSRGWHGAVACVSQRHTPVTFGVSFDTADQTVLFYAMDVSQRIRVSRLMLPHSSVARLFLGRAGRGAVSMQIMDVAYFRGPMDEARVAEVLSRLDYVYGVTVPEGGAT